MGRSVIVKYLCIVLVISLLSACYTVRTTQIEVVKPAKINIPKKIKSVALLNATMLENNNNFANEQQQLYHNFDSLLCKQLITDVSGFLVQSPRFDMVKEHNKLYVKKIEMLNKPLRWNHVEQICYDNNTDALLVLEAVKTQDTVVRISYFDGANFHSSKSVAIINTSFWRLYSYENKEIYHHKNYTDTVYLSDYEEIRYFWGHQKKADVIKETVNKVSFEISQNISNSIAPYWLQVDRYLIDVENDVMKMALRKAKNDNWNDAAKIWKQLITHENKQIAAAACFNMALVSEIKGRTDLALVWLNKSKKKYEFYITNNYINILNKRVKETKKLDKQLKN